MSLEVKGASAPFKSPRAVQDRTVLTLAWLARVVDDHLCYAGRESTYWPRRAILIRRSTVRSYAPFDHHSQTESSGIAASESRMALRQSYLVLVVAHTVLDKRPV